MTNVKNWAVLTNNAWSWDWIGRVFPSSTAIRPSDLDGFVREGNWLLVLDGAVGDRRPVKPNPAWRITFELHPQITYLAMLCPENAFANHSPERITQYYLHAGMWPARAWAWGRWCPVPAYSVDGRQAMADLIAQWAAWAVETTGRWEFIADTDEAAS